MIRLTPTEERKNSLLRKLRRAFAWGRLRLPFGLRAVFGLALLLGGVLWFLPVLGLWMIPLGVALIALDVPPLRRRLRSWLHRETNRRSGARSGQREGG